MGWRAGERCSTLPVMNEQTDEYRRTELMSRETNGIVVRLLWSRATNLVTIAVADAANDERFELVLGKDESPLDVFHHPYAHAAARGLELGSRRPQPEALPKAA